VRLVVDDLVRRAVLRSRPRGWFWTSRERPEIDIRGTGGPPVRLVESGTGRLLGTVDASSAHSQAHTGAVYLHQGEGWLVDELDLDESVALVHAEEPDYSTSARDITDIAIVEELRAASYDGVQLRFGTVDVTHQVVAYLKKRIGSGEVLGEEPLDLPPRQLRTRAVWYTVEPRLLEAAGLSSADVPGAAHAAEHAAIGLLPLFATCDRWDIGGVSTALHPTPARARCSSTTATPAGPASPSRASSAAPRGWGDSGGDRVLRVPARVPILRAVAQVRQRQRTARQGRGRTAARRGAEERARRGSAEVARG
jgi:DEAD/DEAH box helicase domain-containing protein